MKSTAERFAKGISSQNSRGKMTVVKAEGVGAIGEVLSLSIHGASPWKTMGDRDRNDASKAVRPAMMKLRRAIVL